MEPLHNYMGREQLRAQLLHTLSDLNEQLDEVARLASDMSVPTSAVRDAHGGFLMTPILVAKAQVLCALEDMTPEDSHER